MSGGLGQRPLSEVSPMAQRRNSPIWNQSTKMMRNESPFETPSSPRLFWQGREQSGSPFPKSAENQAPYDPEAPFSPSRRASLERLKRQSRVKNNNMFRDHNQEYDPTQVYVPQRPLVTNKSPQRNGPTGQTPQKSSNQDDGPMGPRPPSPSKDQVPPAKSSLSRGSRYGANNVSFDPDSEIWSDFDGRNPKSVTFDAAPPQVNEYEMNTPDPSSIASESREGSYDSEEDEGDISFDRESSMDRDDSFDASLEDLEKTPVVMPEDWRYMNPSNANEDLVKEDEDPFTDDDETHSPDPRPSSRQEVPVRHSRVESLDSNGERRPLPPLPGAGRTSFSPRATSPNKLASAFELGSGGQRVLPSPPGPASYSKSDITDHNNSSMPLEDRLRLMMIQENERENNSLEQQSTEQPQAKTVEDHQDGTGVKDKEDKPEDGQASKDAAADAPESYSPPHISRDSILRDLRKSESYLDDSFEASSHADSNPDHYMHYDPDFPIPSLENDNEIDDDDDDDDANSVIIKEEDHDDDIYDIPDYYETVPSKDSSFKSLNDKQVTDDESRYSSHPLADDLTQARASESDDGQITPTAEERAEQAPAQQPAVQTQEAESNGPSAPKMAAMQEALQRPVTPGDREQMSEPSTPDSVIRHPIDGDESDRDVSPDFSPDEDVPAPIATIKAHGAGLKTRPSLTPADLESMAATRRKISGQIPPPMNHNIPNSQESHEPHEPQESHDSNEAQESHEPQESENPAPEGLTVPKPKELPQRQSSCMKLDIPFSIQEESLGFGLDKEFDRVIETQKRGYLMRHNTKVIIASSHNEEEPAPAPTPTEGPSDQRSARSAAPSPRKASQQTWTTVPWNGQTRRSSMRASSGIRKKPVSGPAPPLPGQQSSVQETPSTIEETEPALNGALDEGEERGRLFVKVVGMKYLDLPIPRGERSYFSLTLDNGLHCVTTAWLELGKSAPIGQEFELIVQNDLEFQLTLQMKVDEDKFRAPEVAPPASPTKPKTSTFSKMFSSPRKRKELDMKQQLASQQQQQKGKDVNAPVYDRLKTLIARDGSFARAYVALSDHEKYAYGRPHTFDVACFNEWAVEDQPSSVKSKKSTSSAHSQRRPPYKIGKLEVQLLFVPKPKGSKEDDMPKSMNACIREMREAETASARSWEGFLSQQGGDCPYWRRRFFKLQGSKLTAFHETTRQPRATINLAKAAKLIDDRSSLTQKETTARGGKRRKSAFAEEEEGYMFVEEGFRIRFGNGEVIDFYADSAAEKDDCMKILADAVGKGSTGSSQAKPWTELVFKHERNMKSRGEQAPASSGPPPPRKDVPPPATAAPAAPAAAPPASRVPAPVAASPRPRHRHTQSQPEVRGADARRQKARSLIF